MSEEVSLNNMLSKDEIYKVSVLNSDGKLDTIYIFSASTRDDKDLPELFSDTQLAFFNAENVKIVFTKDSLIHADDSIQMIKRKIVQELANHSIKTSADELYLFSSAPTFLDMNEIYQEATQNDSVPLNKTSFFHYALNLNIDPFSTSELDKNEDRNEDTVDEDIDSKVPTYETWMELRPSGSYEISIPLGLKFKNRRQYGFSTNPFHIQRTMMFVPSPKNPILQFDNTILLNYTVSKDITVCFAKDVFEYSEKNGLDEGIMCQLYFPNLFSRGIENGPALTDIAEDIAKETAKKWTPGVQHYCDTVATFHKVYSMRKSDLDYSERGIQSYSILFSGGDSEQILPLDILFKNLHATVDIPFIKYNPGYRRENMYRLYADSISKNGKKIPVLSETVIMRLSRELGKGNQIGIYLPRKNINDTV